MTIKQPPLTRREWVVLCLWISGATRQQIADSLGIGFETAKSTVDRISEKRGLRGRFDALRMGADRDRPDRAPAAPIGVSRHDLGASDTPDMKSSG